MRRLALFALLPGVALALDFSSFPGRHSCSDILNSMECARSLEAALKVPYVRRMSESIIQITLLNGSTVSLKDGNAETGISYTAVEVALQGRYVVVHRQFYEGSSYSLLDRSSGKVTDLAGYPVFSPDSRWVAVANADLDAGYSANTLQLYRHSDGRLSLAFDAKPAGWGPERVAWKSATQLSFIH